VTVGALLPGAEPFQADGGPVGVVLLHGFTGCPQSMRPWADYLAAAGLTVRLPRLPGHGTRWQDLQRTGWEDWYGEAERAFDEVHSVCSTVFVMGLSVGGTLSLRLAEERGADVAGLVVVNAMLLTTRRDAKLLPLLRLFVPSFPGVGSDIKAPGQKELAYERLPLRAAYSLSKLWRVVRDELSRVVSPVLVATSREDHVVEPVNSDVIFEGVSSAEKSRLWLEDSYHVATLDNDAPLLFRSSLDFVRAHADEARSPG
jgi:carboxylesterase